MIELRLHLEKTLRAYAVGEDYNESDGDRSEVDDVSYKLKKKCDNKHCSFVDIPYKIKWWKTLWFK